MNEIKKFKSWIKSYQLNRNQKDLVIIIKLSNQDGLIPFFYQSILTDSERQRAERFVVEPPKIQYIITRAFLRLGLSSLLNIEVQSYEFKKNKWGKPLFIKSPYEFNVSHTKNYAAIAFSFQKKIGIDIETKKKEFAAKNIAYRFFSEEEKAFLKQTATNDLSQHFFNIWSGKEAVSKAVGMGMSLNLDSYTVIPTGSKIVVSVPQQSGLSICERWEVDYLAVDEKVSCCIAREKGHQRDINLQVC